MAFDPQRTTMTRAEAARAEIDVGLRSYMLRVYNYMSLGVAFTGAIAMMVAIRTRSLVETIASMFWLFFIAILGLGWIATAADDVQVGGNAAQVLFWVTPACGAWCLARPYGSMARSTQC